MAKTKKTKTQAVRTKTNIGNVRLAGKLFGGKYGKFSYLTLSSDDCYDEIDGARLYRLAKAIVRRFEAAK